MDRHTLERYSFLWSEVRLLIAAVALLVGGVPAIYLIAPPSLFSIARLGLTVCWILSGLAAIYLAWRWYDKKMYVLGGKDKTDAAAFAIMIVSGLNLGFAGVTGTNLGMSILGGRLVLFVVGLLYIWVAYHLYRRWKKNGKEVF